MSTNLRLWSMAWTSDLKTCCCKVSSLGDGGKNAELQVFCFGGVCFSEKAWHQSQWFLRVNLIRYPLLKQDCINRFRFVQVIQVVLKCDNLGTTGHSWIHSLTLPLPNAMSLKLQIWRSLPGHGRSWRPKHMRNR